MPQPRRPAPTPTTELSAPRKRPPSPRPLLRLWPRVRPYRRGLLIAAITLLLSSCLALSFPLVVRYLLDAAFERHDRHLLDQIALGLLAIFATTAVLNYIQTYFLSATGERAVAGLRRELFGKLLEMPPGFFADRRTGELTSRLTVDIGLLQGILSHQLADFTRQLLALVGGVVILTWMQPKLMLTAVGVVPIVALSALIFGKRLKSITTSVQDQLADSTALAEEAFGQIRVVQGFAQEPYERERFATRVGRVVTASLHRARVRATFFGVITFTTFSAVTAVLWMGGRLVLSGQLTPGQMVSFLLYTVSIAAAFGALATFFSAYQEAVGAAQRVFELLETVSPVADPAIPVPLPHPVRGEVAFDDVTFAYRTDTAEPTIQGLTLRIAPGEVVAVVGPSGAGKTTLASLLPRFWDVDQGAIRLDGIDIRDLTLADLRHAIGIVPQEPALFSGTVRENIAYARPDASAADVEAAAQVANAHEFIVQLPEQYETVVGERGVKLSGGQRQRIAIARAVLKDPAVLVLDEATSSLDNESERLVEMALERLLVGRTTLIIAHRLSTVQRADRLVVLDAGKIVEEGTHAELLRRGGIYARLFQMQWRGGENLAEALAALKQQG
ncbi:MAG: ATP-binding cassette domain-containing protein [Gemmatimonadetes bacterium]|nr:ATP-binding cassette domain-containing protein [Gemmatimonadota bacterium]